jgi:hypothetical protein
MDKCDDEGRKGSFIVVRKDCNMSDSKRNVSGEIELFQDTGLCKLYSIL